MNDQFCYCSMSFPWRSCPAVRRASTSITWVYICHTSYRMVQHWCESVFNFTDSRAEWYSLFVNMPPLLLKDFGFFAISTGLFTGLFPFWRGKWLVPASSVCICHYWTLVLTPQTLWNFQYFFKDFVLFTIPLSSRMCAVEQKLITLSNGFCF